MKTTLIAWILAFFTPLLPLMLVVGLFILFDTYMGRLAVSVKAKREGKNPRDYVKSSKTRAGLFKKLLMYNLVLISIHLIDLYVIADFVRGVLPFTHLVTRLGVVVLCWVEYDSIDEKYYRIKGVTLTCVIRQKMEKFKQLLGSIFKFVKMGKV